MTTIILSSDTFTAFGPGTVGAIEISYDFGSGRVANFSYEIEVTSVTGFTTTQIGFQWSPDVTIPTPVWTLGPNENFTVPVSSPFSLTASRNNLVQTSIDPSGIGRNIRAFLFLFGTGSATATVLLTDSESLVLEDGSGIAGANVYLAIPDVLARMADWRPGHFTAFLAATEARQQAIWVDATREIELVVARCPDGSPVSLEPAVQTLLFPRTLATDAQGRDIVGLVGLGDYFDGLILFAEEKAKAEAAGKPLAAPAEGEGVAEIEVEPAQAGYRQKWAGDGKSGSFWFSPGRDEIRRLMFSAFPRRARG